MIDKDLEKRLEEGKIKACPFCEFVYEIKVVDGKEEFIVLDDISFKDIKPKYYQSHKECEENYNRDPGRFKCGSDEKQGIHENY